MPGSIPPTSQLDWLISTTVIRVLSWSRATRDLLKSFGGGHRGTPSVTYSDDGAISSSPAPYHLSAGGKRIRTVGPPRKRDGFYFALIDVISRSDDQLPNQRWDYECESGLLPAESPRLARFCPLTARSRLFPRVCGSGRCSAVSRGVDAAVA